MKLGELMTPIRSRSGRRRRSGRRDPAGAWNRRPVIGERLEVRVVSEADIIAKEAGPDPAHRRLIRGFLGGRYVDRQKIEAARRPRRWGRRDHRRGPRNGGRGRRRMTQHEIKRNPRRRRGGRLDRDRHPYRPCPRVHRSDDEIERRSARSCSSPLARRAGPPPSRRARRGQAGRQDAAASDAELLARLARRVPESLACARRSAGVGRRATCEGAAGPVRSGSAWNRR